MDEEKQEVQVTDGAQLPVEAALNDIFAQGEWMDSIDEIVFPVIKILHQSTAQFEFPDGDTMKSFDAVILDIHNVRAYWDTAFSGGGAHNMPTCFSFNCVHPESNAGEGIQTDACASCGQNKWDTAVKADGSPGRGKACKQMKRLHLLVRSGAYADSDMPLRLVAPPSNLKAVNAYVTTLAARKIPFCGVVTNFALKTETNLDNIKFSRLEISCHKGDDGAPVTLPINDVRTIIATIDKYKGAMRQSAIGGEETGSSTEDNF